MLRLDARLVIDAGILFSYVTKARKPTKDARILFKLHSDTNGLSYQKMFMVLDAC
jgi:hypothetical protein